MAYADDLRILGRTLRWLPAMLLARPGRPYTAADLIDQAYLAYNAGRLQKAARLFVDKMLAPDCVVGLHVEQPRRWPVGASVGRHDDPRRTVVGVDEDRVARLARLPTGRGEHQARDPREPSTDRAVARVDPAAADWQMGECHQPCPRTPLRQVQRTVMRQQLQMLDELRQRRTIVKADLSAPKLQARARVPS